MIGRIAGRLEYRATDHVLIDVRGVGYVVYVSDRVLAQLPGPGRPWRSIPSFWCARISFSSSAFRRWWKRNGTGCCSPCRASAPRRPWRSWARSARTG